MFRTLLHSEPVREPTLFMTGNFMPHGYCYLWNPQLVWLHVISDSLITLSYYCIPVLLIYFARRRRDLPFGWLFWMFGFFILGCGTTHLMEVWTVWHPSYLLSGVIKALTAAVSLATAVLLVPMIPKAISLGGIAELHEINRKLEKQISEYQQSGRNVDASLRRYVTIGLLASMFVIGLLGFFGWRGSKLAASDSDLVTHTADVMRTLESTLKDVLAIQIGARSFAATGQEEFLTLSGAGQNALHQDIQNLRTLTADNSDRRQQLALLTTQVDAAGRSGEQLTEVRRRTGLVPSSSRFLASKDYMDAVQAIVAQMEADEASLFRQRSTNTQASRRSATILTAAGTVSGICFLALASASVVREIKISGQTRRQIGVLNSELEQRIEQRTHSLRLEARERKHAEEALRESETRLSGIIDSAMDAIITTDEEQRVLLFNNAAEKMFQVASTDAVGQPISQFMPERFRSAHHDHMRAFGSTGVTSRGMGTTRTLWGLRRDGTEFPLDASISRVAMGGRKLFTVILRDISEKEYNEALRLQLAGVVESTDSAILSKDLTGHITGWNKAAERLYGYSEAEVLGKHVNLLIPPEFREEEAEVLQEVGSGKLVRRGETTRARKDGTQIYVSSIASPVKDAGGRVVGILTIGEDVTERKHTQATLQEQAQVLDLAQVMVRDMAGKIMLWSQGNEELYGFSPHEAVGRISHDLLRTVFPQPLEEIEKSLLSTGRWEGQLIHRKKSGEEVAVASAWAVHSDVHGKPKRIMEASIDVSEREKAKVQLAAQTETLSRQAEELTRSREALQAQTQLLQLILDSMDEGLVAADEQGRFLLWNPAAEKILGTHVKDIAAPDWAREYGLYLPDGENLFPADRLPLVLAMRGQPADLEMVVRQPEFVEPRWIEVSARPMRTDGGAACGAVAAFRDITQRKKAESEIRELTDQLEQRVLRRTEELQAANHELEAFTYSVSHDLRAPLRHIAGFAGILIEEFGAKLDPQAHHYLNRITEGIRKMGTLVDELLTLARVGRQTVSLQVAGLDSIVAEVVAMLKPEQEGRQIDWRIAKMPFVECDPMLMKQVFQNLISNALKYSRPRGEAVIEIGQTEVKGVNTIFVRDNGVGFSMKYADKLFGVFQRLHRPEDFEGTGVGLATVQRIIHKHGGQVWAEAELDRGATFYFTLPASDQKQQPERTPNTLGARA